MNLSNVKLLTNNSEITSLQLILPESKNKGVYFRLSHFMIFLYRLSIVTFTYNRSKQFVSSYLEDTSENQISENYNSKQDGKTNSQIKQDVIKFLYMLRSFEI